MVILRVFTILPAWNPKSDDVWINRSTCDSLASAKESMMQSWPEAAGHVLKELTGMGFDADAFCAVAKDGTRHSLCSLPDDVCAALGVIVLSETRDKGKVFPMLRELESARTLRALHALPQTFRFALTRAAYDRIICAVEGAIRAQAKAAKKNAQEKSWLFMVEQYDFAVESPDVPMTSGQDAPELKDVLPAEWEREPALLRRALLARRNKLPALLYTIPETELGVVDGVPVTGRLLFAPDAQLPICVFPRRPARFGVHGILHCGGKITTTNQGDVTRGGLLAVCSYVRHLAKPEADGTAICLVTDGSAAPEHALFCITATPGGIHVSDYRAAYEEFAEAVKCLLPPENSGKPIDSCKNDGI